MKFGVFDHVDASGSDLATHLENRLKMAEIYDSCGLYCYHVAEHHGTPLGMAPSPGILFAALSQRTSTIKFGPLVYLLPIYHPLRLIEEVAMIDCLSAGRFQLGVGRGVSPLEMGFYGVDMDQQRERFSESLEILIKGLSGDRLNHHGKFFDFDDVPMELRPVQAPHPPLWYGAGSPESIAWCARENINIVTLALGERVRQVTDLYRDSYAKAGNDPDQLPFMGISRHIVVAPTDAQAEALAAPAYARWRASLAKLWEDRGTGFPLGALYPPDWRSAEAMGHGCAGSPEKVRNFVGKEITNGQINYLASWFAFGNLSVDDVAVSVELFSQEVMPSFT